MQLATTIARKKYLNITIKLIISKIDISKALIKGII